MSGWIFIDASMVLLLHHFHFRLHCTLLQCVCWRRDIVCKVGREQRTQSLNKAVIFIFSLIKMTYSHLLTGCNPQNVHVL